MKSQYIDDNKLGPIEASHKGLDSGAAQITIEVNNGAIEVRNGNNVILLQAKNVKAGTFNAIWKILESAADIDYRA